MRVAVCIVGFRNRDDIIDALGALSRSTHSDFQVVICENGGAEAYAALAAVIPPSLAGGQPVLAFDATSNLGYAGGVNAAMRAAPDADAWWVLNPDTVPDPTALAELIARLARGDCEAVGCTVYFDGSVVESRGGRWRAWMARPESIDYGLGLDDPPSTGRAAEPAYLSGASMLVGRRFLETVGYMREDYFLYAEEVEWCLRGREMGMRLTVAPAARVLHHQGSTTGSVQDIRLRGRTPVYLDERNKLLVTRDRFPARFPVAAVAAFLLIFLRFARKAAWKPLGYALAGWTAGVLNRRGPPSWITV